MAEDHAAASQINPREIDSLLARRRQKAFSPGIEALYLQRTANYRRAYLRDTCFGICAVYNLFLVTDWFLVPDVFRLSVALHVLAVTPFLLALAFLVQKRVPRLVREGLAGLASVAVNAGIIATFWMSESPQSLHYLYFAILPTIGAAAVQRLQMPVLAAVTAVNLALPLTTAFTSARLDDLALLNMAAVMIASAGFAILARNATERESRWSFLHRLRDELHTRQLSASNLELEDHSNRDALTGLPNRRRLDAYLAKAAQSCTPASELAVLMVDVDCFKQYNDRHGHLQGDLCLKAVAGLLESQVRRESDLLGRYGGEEFMVILPQCGLDGARLVAERLRAIVAKAKIVHGAPGQPFVTVSIGLGARQMVDTALAAAVIAQADAALYEAKHHGRNLVWPPSGDQTEIDTRLTA